jgi:hypothetical protein
MSRTSTSLPYVWFLLASVGCSEGREEGKGARIGTVAPAIQIAQTIDGVDKRVLRLGTVASRRLTLRSHLGLKQRLPTRA